MDIKELPKRITLEDVLHSHRWILELIDEFGMEIPDDIDGREFKKYWEQYCDHPSYATNYYFAETIRKGLNKYFLGKDKEVNECGAQGGATPASVGGMGDIVLPGGDSAGSGDLPLPTGGVYKQVQPFDQFIKKAGWKKKKKKFKGKPTKNGDIYAYVDDFKTYAKRIGHIDESKLTEDDYLHGFCYQWVFENYEDGDEIFVMTDYDPDIKDYALLHCGLMRDGKFVDVRGEMETKEEVLEPFDYSNELDIEILNLEEFKYFCRDFGLDISHK